MGSYVMQARSSTSGAMVTWPSSSPDWAAAGFPGPGTAQEVAVSSVPAGGGGGGGEANTGANVGAGEGNVFRDKTGLTLNMKTLKAGTNMTITDGEDEVTFDAAAGAGEANTAANVGSGIGVFRNKTGVTLNMKSLVAVSENVKILDATDTVTLDAFGWHTALDIDFRTEASQTLSPDGTYTIGGRPWLKRNSANDRVAMAIVNGTGLVIAPGSVSNWDGGVYTMPLIEIPFTSISSGLAFGRPIRITVYVAGNGSNFSTNYDFLSFGVSSQSGVAGYQLSKGYNATQIVQPGVIGASVAGSTPRGQTFSTANNIVRLLVPILGEANVMALTAEAGNGGSEIPSERFFDPVSFYFDSGKNLSALTRAATSLVIGALRSGGSDAAFTVTIARVVVEYLGFASADISGVPGASLSGARWLLPFIANLGGGSQSCPSATTETVVMSGTPGTTYNVTLRFQGAVETKAYSGGTNDGAYWQVGGAPTADAGQYNTYKLTVSNPAATYYLNRAAAPGPVAAVDYSKTIQIAAGATVTLTADSLNSAELDHSVSVPGVTVPAQPYAGQFMNMTVTAIS